MLNLPDELHDRKQSFLPQLESSLDVDDSSERKKVEIALNYQQMRDPSFGGAALEVPSCVCRMGQVLIAALVLIS